MTRDAPRRIVSEAAARARPGRARRSPSGTGCPATMRPPGRRGRVVRQRPAKPRTAVRIRSSPSTQKVPAKCDLFGARRVPRPAPRAGRGWRPATLGAAASSAPDLEHVLPFLRPGGRKLFHDRLGWHRSGRFPAALQLLLAAVARERVREPPTPPEGATGLEISMIANDSTSREVRADACAMCGREIRDASPLAEHWTWRSDGVGGLVSFCGACAKSLQNTKRKAGSPGS